MSSAGDSTAKVTGLGTPKFLSNTDRDSIPRPLLLYGMLGTPLQLNPSRIIPWERVMP